MLGRIIRLVVTFQRFIYTFNSITRLVLGFLFIFFLGCCTSQGLMRVMSQTCSAMAEAMAFRIVCVVVLLLPCLVHCAVADEGGVGKVSHWDVRDGMTATSPDLFPNCRSKVGGSCGSCLLDRFVRPSLLLVCLFVCIFVCLLVYIFVMCFGFG